MPEVRIHKFPEKKYYAKVPNYAARDPRLSFGAIGLLTYLLSMPPNHVVLKKNIIKNQKKVTRTLLDNYFMELEKFGYMIVKDQVVKNGKFSSLDYLVFSAPFNETSRTFDDPFYYPETEEQPMLQEYIGESDIETAILGKKDAQQVDLSDVASLHRPMQSPDNFPPSTPYKDLKEISNKTSIAAQVLKIIYDLRYEFTADPEEKKRLRIPAETASRVSMVKSRQKEFYQAFGKEKDFVAAVKWVFTYKAAEWSGDHMWKYFDPETLLNSENFIKYCEACKRDNGNPPVKPVKKSQVTETPSVASSPESYHQPRRP